MKKIMMFVAIFIITIGVVFVNAVLADCNIGANFNYGSSPITAYGKVEAVKDDGRGWNNYLKVHCKGYQIKNGGVKVNEDGGEKIKYNSGSVESRIYVDWGKGVEYTNEYQYKCNYCGLDSGIQRGTFVFSN